MNFLIKIEEAINSFIEKVLGKLKGLVPEMIFYYLEMLKHFPAAAKKKYKTKYLPKMRVTMLKFIGYTQHYTTLVRGHLMSVIMYLRSDEFKKANKKDLLLKPVRYAKFHPLKALTFLSTFAVVFAAFFVIYQNAEKIVLGTKALRKPASVETPEEDNSIVFKNHKFEVKMAPAGGHGGGHGGGGGEEHEVELFLDVKVEAQSEEDKKYLEYMEEMLDDNLEALELPVAQLPLSPENTKQIEEMMTKSLNEDFKQIGHDNPIKTIQLKQVLEGRPVYYKQAERMMTIEDINLQLFLEDTHRNKQVWIDFSILASNRNVILYLKDHEVELKDHLSTNVEPVIPQLPVEEEGKQIIKDKMRDEINQFLEKNHVEGKVLEIYVDYLMVS